MSDITLSKTQSDIIRQTLIMARAVLADENYENAAIQCTMALEALDRDNQTKDRDNGSN